MKTNIPPETPESVISTEKLVEVLSALIGNPFTLTYKPRTDGANIRKLITKTLEEYATNAESSAFEIIPPKRKGIPKLLSHLIDTYVITSGTSYNLQVWNRNPNGKTPLVVYDDGKVITPQDIRLVMVKVSVENGNIASITVLSPEYVENKFGKFGKPTIKNQLLINAKQRTEIINSDKKILFYPDTKKLQNITHEKAYTSCPFSDSPNPKNLLSLHTIKETVASKLIGMKLDAADTKTRGQQLERIVISLLGYNTTIRLVGGYPDVPNQLLEVKIQDTQTVDLGRYSPQFEEIINNELNLTTLDVRYLIALTNSTTNEIEGIVLTSGEFLGNKFTYVSDTSYKCQRSIPMPFFDKQDGKCEFNP